MSRESVARALRERAERLAREAWEGAQTGAEVAYRAGAGLVGAPQGPGRTYSQGGGIGSDRAAARDYSGSGYGDSSIGSRISSDLQRDFGLTADQAAGIVGNLGHESGGFKYYQEISPTSGRGGAGWAQWTDTRGSPRRTAFENYTRANNLNPNSYEANYGFLKHELTGTHKGALTAVKKANTVQDAVYAFEGEFERAGVKNYSSRMRYANSLGASSAADTRVADLQRNLNAAGANIPVDGLMGPLTRGAMAKYPNTAQAYTSTAANNTPAMQAAAQMAAGTLRGGGDQRVAAMQRDLNSRGANLKVDGIRGPLTMAAEKNFLGSPTSVRTPSFTAKPSYTSATATPGTVGMGARAGPYTGSTGGAAALQPTAVPTTAIKAAPYGGTQLPSYTNNITYPNAVQAGARPVPTAAVPASGRGPLGNVFGAFSSPYTSSTGGANAIQAPRIPQARPAYPPPSLPAAAGPTIWQQMQERQRLAAAEAAQRDAQARSSQGSRSGGGGYSGGGGGGYTGGSYGGYGGGSLTSGVGGAYRSR